MSDFLTIPINEHGIILDRRFEERLQAATPSPFGLTDVFLYSQGLRGTGSPAPAERAFSLGFAKALQGLVCASPGQWPKINAAFAPLALPIHWPFRPEEQGSVADFRETTSCITLQQRADSAGQHAGYALLRSLIERQKDGQPYRFNLIGHSFGCRVLCSALQALAADDSMLPRLACNEFNVALLQPAADSDSLAPGRSYGQVQRGIPKLRMLVTTSGADTALSTWYPEAQHAARAFSGAVEAMGCRGPTGDLLVPVDQRFDVTNAVVPTFTGRLGVANLTSLHGAAASECDMADGWSGQHAHINRPQIHDLLARFFGQ